MLYTEMTKKAMQVAYDAHRGQKDKSGVPYVFHSLHIAEGMECEESTIVALLHDVVEDTDYTLSDLVNMGFSRQAIQAIDLLTHNPNDSYMEYIKKLSINTIAIKVKLADLAHNSDLTRLNEVTKKDLERVEKYKKAMEFLEKFL